MRGVKVADVKIRQKENAWLFSFKFYYTFYFCQTKMVIQQMVTNESLDRNNMFASLQKQHVAQSESLHAPASQSRISAGVFLI